MSNLQAKSSDNKEFRTDEVLIFLVKISQSQDGKSQYLSLLKEILISSTLQGNGKKVV